LDIYRTTRFCLPLIKPQAQLNFGESLKTAKSTIQMTKCGGSWALFPPAKVTCQGRHRPACIGIRRQTSLMRAGKMNFRLTFEPPSSPQPALLPKK
jgi:hypothetical protein